MMIMIMMAVVAPCLVAVVVALSHCPHITETIILIIALPYIPNRSNDQQRRAMWLRSACGARRENHGGVAGWAPSGALIHVMRFACAHKKCGAPVVEARRPPKCVISSGTNCLETRCCCGWSLRKSSRTSAQARPYLQTSGLQFPSMKLSEPARRNFPNTVNVFEGPPACPQAM